MFHFFLFQAGVDGFVLMVHKGHGWFVVLVQEIQGLSMNPSVEHHASWSIPLNVQEKRASRVPNDPLHVLQRQMEHNLAIDSSNEVVLLDACQICRTVRFD